MGAEEKKAGGGLRGGRTESGGGVSGRAATRVESGRCAASVAALEADAQSSASPQRVSLSRPDARGLVRSHAVRGVMPEDGGGSVWESNPPNPTPSGHTGFEDQGSHQAPSTPNRQASVTPRSAAGITSPISTASGTSER